MSAPCTTTAIVILLALSLVSCGTDNSPAGLTSRYIEAGKAGDQAGMKACLSPLAIEAFARKPGGTTVEEALTAAVQRFATVTSFEITATEDKGGYTLVSLTLTLNDESLRQTKWPIRAYDGQWLLDELKAP